MANCSHTHARPRFSFFLARANAKRDAAAPRSFFLLAHRTLLPHDGQALSARDRAKGRLRPRGWPGMSKEGRREGGSEIKFEMLDLSRIVVVRQSSPLFSLRKKRVKPTSQRASPWRPLPAPRRRNGSQASCGSLGGLRRPFFARLRRRGGERETETKTKKKHRVSEPSRGSENEGDRALFLVFDLLGTCFSPFFRGETRLFSPGYSLSFQQQSGEEIKIRIAARLETRGRGDALGGRGSFLLSSSLRTEKSPAFFFFFFFCDAAALAFSSFFFCFPLYSLCLLLQFLLVQVGEIQIVAQQTPKREEGRGRKGGPKGESS